MGEFDQLPAWRDLAIARSLAWYRAVAENRMPAKFRIAATIPVGLPIDDAPEDALWRELERLTPRFLKRWAGIREGREALGAREGPSLLDLCRALAYRMLAHCNFCRWNCRVDRTRGARFGACKLAAPTRVSTYFHHPGEELVYRGAAGSGTIFFTSCNIRCAFCQNGDISTDKDNGEVTDARTLAAMACCCARKAHTTSTGSAARSRSICTPLSRRSRCSARSSSYRPQYAEIARRPKASEIRDAYRHAEQLGLHYETVTFERSDPERYASIRGI